MPSGIDKLKDVKAGDPLSAAQANLINRLLRREVTGPYIYADSTGWHFRSRPMHRLWGFWARLTAEAEGGGGYYSWTRLKDDAETLVDPTETGTDNAKEVNEAEGIKGHPDTGVVVWMWPDRTVRDPPPDQPEYRFVRFPPGGTEDWQLLVWNNTDKVWEVGRPRLY